MDVSQLLGARARAAPKSTPMDSMRQHRVWCLLFQSNFYEW